MQLLQIISYTLKIKQLKHYFSGRPTLYRKRRGKDFILTNNCCIVQIFNLICNTIHCAISEFRQAFIKLEYIFDKFQNLFNYKEGIRLRVVGTGRLRQYGLHIDTVHFNTTPLSQIRSINFSSETTIVMDIICCTAGLCV